jgi:hypothetical protein
MGASNHRRCCCGPECCDFGELASNGGVDCTYCDGLKSVDEWTATVSGITFSTTCQACGGDSARFAQSASDFDLDTELCVTTNFGGTGNGTNDQSCGRFSPSFGSFGILARKQWWSGNSTCTGTATLANTSGVTLELRRTSTGFDVRIFSTTSFVSFILFEGSVTEELCCPPVLEFTNSIMSYSCTPGAVDLVYCGTGGTVVLTPCC